MNFMKIKTNCISNGEGIRTALFVTGCSHKCKGCFNAVAWNPKSGEPYTTDILEFILDSMKYPYVDGLSLLGGEPFEEYNLDDLITLCRMTRDIYNKDKSIWVYSGYTFEELIKLSGGTTVDDYEIISGGPMTGVLSHKRAVVTKTTNGILVMPETHVVVQKRKAKTAVSVNRAKSSCCHCRMCTDWSNRI